jgi:hypothetical protein
MHRVIDLRFATSEMQVQKKHLGGNSNAYGIEKSISCAYTTRVRRREMVSMHFISLLLRRINRRAAAARPARGGQSTNYFPIAHDEAALQSITAACII